MQLNEEVKGFFKGAEKVILVSFGTLKKPKNESMGEILKAIGMM